MKKITKEHQKATDLQLSSHKIQGKHTIKLDGKSPDGIAIDWKNQRVIAIKIVSGDVKPLGHRLNYYKRQLTKRYKSLGFDDIEITLFYRDGSKNLKAIHYKDSLNKFPTKSI